MKTGLIFIVVLMLIATSSVQADADSETPWPIEERCVSNPTKPPDGWTFEGTIITTGWAGIHGMNAAWDTPQILAFDDGWITSGGFGTISPDGRWYAVPQATFRSESLYWGWSAISQLLIYDLVDRHTILRIEWNDSYELFFGSSSSRYYTFRTPVWFDNETVIYQRGKTYYFVHVRNLEIEEWTSPSKWKDVSPVWIFISHPSPDWSRIVARTNSIELFNAETNEIIAEVYRPTANIDLPSIAWHPDSTEFIVAGALSTILYDRSGKLLNIISLPLEEDEFNNLYISQNAYSSDGTMFYAFAKANSRISDQWNLVLANRSNHTIIDTCIDSNISAQFSPDGQHIAILGHGSGQQELQIFDIQNWKLYRTNIFHDGEIVGWRTD